MKWHAGLQPPEDWDCGAELDPASPHPLTAGSLMEGRCNPCLSGEEHQGDKGAGLCQVPHPCGVFVRSEGPGEGVEGQAHRHPDMKNPRTRNKPVIDSHGTRSTCIRLYMGHHNSLMLGAEITTGEEPSCAVKVLFQCHFQCKACGT